MDGLGCLKLFKSSNGNPRIAVSDFGVKSFIVIILASIVVSSFSLTTVVRSVSAQDLTVYTISGYILDSNGNGIKGAEIIFNVPDIVRSVYSDNTGHYIAYAPAGSYHLNVWPPWDSNYIYYDQPGLVVASDTTKNITLNQGFKISGYIRDSSGNPVKDAVVSLNGYLVGWFSNYQGYYFVCAPAGTYKFNASPRSGYHHFVAVSESNFSLKSHVTKNVTVALTDASTPSPNPMPPPSQSSFKISGYILDSNGKGIGGANIIFGVPDVVPSVYSDSSGYYAIYAPVGSYHVNVWPPFDSNFINYDQPTFVVGSDLTKNITLNPGYKLSGYITSTLGEPVKNGIVSLNGLLSGWFSKDTGYYFVCAPAGTYTLTANPRSGYNHFLIYREENFILDDNKVKNITVVLTGTSTPSPTPEPTPTPLPEEAWISISVDANSSVVGSMINVKGRLTDYQGTPLTDQPVKLSYAETNSLLSWTPIGSGTTSSTGEYAIQWKIALPGNFLLKVEWLTNDNFPRAFNTTSVGFLPYDGSMKIESDSTVSKQVYAMEMKQVYADIGNWLWIAAFAIVLTFVVAGVVAVQVMKKRKIAIR